MVSTKQVDPSPIVLQHRTDIDGLRGIAVLAVVLYHFHLGLPGGYLGVDVFFVISGFLITSLILRRIEAGTFSLADFFERRVRRIAPAALVTMAVTLVVGAVIFALPEDRLRLGRAVIAQVLMSGNRYHYELGQDYFHPAEHEPLPLLHTWSLAVEEQFYLLFPPLLWLVRRWRRGWITGVILVLLAESLLLQFLPYEIVMLKDSARFYLLTPRAWELLIGALIAVVKVRSTSFKWGTEVLALGAMALVLGLFVSPHKLVPESLSTLVTCLGTALILLTYRPDGTFVHRALSTPPLRWVGLISYSLYLIHWPLWTFYNYFVDKPPGLWPCVGLLVTSLALAWLSWRYVETPVRERSLFTTRWRLAAAFVVTSVLLLVGGGIVPLFAVSTDARVLAFEKECATWPLDCVGFEADGPSRVGRPEDPPAFILWGDSHAPAVRPVVDDLTRSYQVSAYLCAMSGKRPFASINPEDDAKTYKGLDPVQGDAILDAVIRLAKQERIPMVMLVSRWNYSDKEPWFEPTLRKTVDRLTHAGLRCIILRDTPEIDNHSMSIWRRRASRGLSTPDLVESLNNYQQRSARSNGFFNRLNAPGSSGSPESSSKVVLLDPTPYFIEGDPDLLRGNIGDVLLYRDVDHLSPAGARRLRPLLEPYIREAAESVRQRP